MNRISLLSLFISLFLLTACLPASAAYSGDPEVAAIQARGVLEQATLMAGRTAEAEVAQARATEVAQAAKDKASEKELAVIEARAAERLAEVQLQQTEAAIWALAGTATAAPQATEWALQQTQPALQATQNTIARAERNAESFSAALRALLDNAPILITLLIAILALLLGIVVTVAMQWISWRKQVVFTPTGYFVPQKAGMTFFPALESGKPDNGENGRSVRRQLSGLSDAQAIDVTPSGAVWKFTTQARRVESKFEVKEKVLSFLDDAIAIVGGEADKIPSWRAMQRFGWNSEAWQAQKGWLEDQELVESNTTGTYILDFSNLAQLRFAIETEQI